MQPLCQAGERTTRQLSPGILCRTQPQFTHKHVIKAAGQGHTPLDRGFTQGHLTYPQRLFCVTAARPMRAADSSQVTAARPIGAAHTSTLRHSCGYFTSDT